MLKRVIDIVLALHVLALLTVVFPLIGLAICLDTKGPIFFSCFRLGKNGKIFKIWKFRTMVHQAPERFAEDGSRIVDRIDPRVTRIGRLLRVGFDELPQVLNILRGEMSFIGPRPDDVFAIDLYEGTDWLKLSIRPGLSGLPQVSGRNDLKYKDRLKLDAYYALKRNLTLDIAIAFHTVFQMIGLRDRSQLVRAQDIEVALSNPLASAAACEMERLVRFAKAQST